jgi:pyruvate/2-oxoglutarate dehydrogenase complex dihydrolipoamide dehydrogenase (E3) component
MAGWLRAHDYDLVVIGAGSAGVWASQYAARLGARVALVEKLRIGGDCTHYGCVPSKALLKAAGVAWAMRDADRFGLTAVDPAPEVRLERVMASVREAIERVYSLETPESLGRAGIDVVMGVARFVDSHTLLVGEGTRMRARWVLVCTGASPTLPSIAGLDDIEYWTYETVWAQTRLPRHLLVLGSGPVGTELSQAFARLGSRVTVFERGDRPVRIADPAASALLRGVLEEEGVQFRFGAHIDSVRQQGKSVVAVDRGEPVAGDALLVAVGRRPTVEGLALERAGVKYSERGIQVNDQLQTTQDHIYACGDVIGGFQFTHYAAWQASVAVRNILFPGRSGGVRAHVPWTLFTDPEVAHCGLSDVEARERLPSSEPVRVVTWSLDHVDRAVTDRSFNGFIKVITRADGTIVGADIVSPRAGETVHEFALAMDHRLKLGELSSTMHVYPTYAVGVQQLAADERVRGLQHSRWVKVLRQVGTLRRT